VLPTTNRCSDPLLTHTTPLIRAVLRLQGLVVKARTNLQPHKVAFAHDIEPQKDLLSSVHAMKPTVLIGASTTPGAFTESVVKAMAKHNERPIIFPLSNPTQLAECTFKDAMTWTNGKVLFASGSPFPDMMFEGKKYCPAQANNAYIFPAVGHAAILSQASRIPDTVFLLAAEVLSRSASAEDLDHGQLFPSFDAILQVSERIMLAACRHFQATGISGRMPVGSWEEEVAQSFWVKHSSCKL
jgi:malate dehydrogenase (oxaloacetate-decarboxylating)(NADP+)